ncbi:MAG: ATP-binding protein, partial [Steroidobacteraceae bacterium]
MAAAMINAVRTGYTQLLEDDARPEGTGAVTYSLIHPAYPPDFSETYATPEQRQSASLGVVIATFDLKSVFSETRQFAEDMQGQITVWTSAGRRSLNFGPPLQGPSMSDDTEVQANVQSGELRWSAMLHKRAAIASVGDIRPADVALSIISLLLGIGMAHATLETVRRRREIEREVQRRTVKLAREVRTRRRVEQHLRSAQDQLNSVFAAIPIPTLIVHCDSGRILDCNASTQDLTTRSMADIRNATLTEAGLPPLDLLTSVGSDGAELELETPTGARRYVVTSRDLLVDESRAVVICFVDITRLHEVEAGLLYAKEQLEERVAARTAELDASRKQIRAAMDHSPIGLAMVDLEGRWFDVNDAMCEILGYTRQELVNLDVYRISHPDDLELTFRQIGSLLSGQSEACSFEKRYVCKDGQIVWVQLDLAVVRDEKYLPIHFVGQIQDITDKRKKAEELRLAAAELELLNRELARERESLSERVAERTAELREANEVLKRANEKATQASRAKSEFVAVMSHEIRTPLNGVIGALDILESSSMRGDQRELVSMGVEAARGLLTIVDDILDFSRIEAGMIDIDDAEFVLEERMSVAVECMLPMARRLDADLTVWIDPELPHRVRGDEVRIQQILRNLLANALKFSAGLSRRSAVSVSARLVRDGGQPRVRIEVHDNGIGMGEAAVARLFQPFTQADQSTTRRFGGSGLGLSICARLAQLMGGRIEVTSKPDVGSVFTVDLPLVVATWKREATPLQGLSVELVGKAQEFIGDLAASLSAEGAIVVGETPAVGCVTVVDLLSADGDPLESVLARGGDEVGIVLLTRIGPRHGEVVAPGVVTLDRQAMRIESLSEAIL